MAQLVARWSVDSEIQYQTSKREIIYSDVKGKFIMAKQISECQTSMSESREMFADYI